MEGDELAVDVAFRNHIVVHQHQASHTGPDEGLGGSGAHAPQAKDSHPRAPEPRHTRIAHKESGALILKGAHRMVPPPRTTSPS